MVLVSEIELRSDDAVAILNVLVVKSRASTPACFGHGIISLFIIRTQSI